MYDDLRKEVAWIPPTMKNVETINYLKAII